MHLNSAERLADGDYVVSARHFNAVERIDRHDRQRRVEARRHGPTTGIALTVLDANGATPPAAGGRIDRPSRRPGAHRTATSPSTTTTSAARRVANEYRLDLGAGTATLVSQRISANPSGWNARQRAHASPTARP